MVEKRKREVQEAFSFKAQSANPPIMGLLNFKALFSLLDTISVRNLRFWLFPLKGKMFNSFNS